jgi:hypothetical protein
MGKRVPSGCHDNPEDAEAMRRAMYAREPQAQMVVVEQEVGGRTQIQLTFLTEMKGQYPDIRLPNDIDRDYIREMGRKYVTLPSARWMWFRTPHLHPEGNGATSSPDQRTQTRGCWGHIKPEDYGTAYALPAVRWLAAQMDDDGIIWAKGPLQTAETQRFRLARATNARVGTSLYAWADQMERQSRTDLIRLDLAPTAGIPMTAARPHISAEMQGESMDKVAELETRLQTIEVWSKPETTNSASSELIDLPADGDIVKGIVASRRGCPRCKPRSHMRRTI